MKLQSVEIENFRFIKEIAVSFEENVTVLIGKNATGKTAILEAVAMALSPAIENFLDGDGSPLHSGFSLKRSDFRLISAGIETALPEAMTAGFFDYRPSVDFVSVSAEAKGGVRWIARRQKNSVPPVSPIFGEGEVRHSGDMADLWRALAPARDAIEKGMDAVVPVFAYYRTKRSGNSIAVRVKKPGQDSNENLLVTEQAGRLAALSMGLRSHLSLTDAVDWFLFEEDLERRGKIDNRNFEYQSPRLSVVRKAVEAILPGCRNPRSSIRPRSLIVTYDYGGGDVQDLLVSQLSDGYRTIFTLVVDLARRMAQANPHLDNPLAETDAIVLIDELDLHLHPAWQQRILHDLRKCFQRTQFIVSTHSPHVISSVGNDQIRVLWREGGELRNAPPDTSPYGAKSGQVLNDLMGISERPPSDINTYVSSLSRYWNFVREDKWDTAEALDCRKLLDKVARHDPELMRIDMDIRRRQLQRSRNKE